MAHKRATLGNEGETLAADYLAAKGYTIICRNFRSRSGEVDIIARNRSTLVFVEVKTRRMLNYGSPAAAVTPRKQSQISRAALEYLARKNLFDSEIRFDVISIITSNDLEPQIEHIPAAFEFAG